jgi:hypothetical protein
MLNPRSTSCQYTTYQLFVVSLATSSKGRDQGFVIRRKGGARSVPPRRRNRERPMMIVPWEGCRRAVVAPLRLSGVQRSLGTCRPYAQQNVYWRHPDQAGPTRVSRSPPTRAFEGRCRLLTTHPPGLKRLPKTEACQRTRLRGASTPRSQVTPAPRRRWWGTNPMLVIARYGDTMLGSPHRLPGGLGVSPGEQ